MARKYELKRRAERVADTRRRIVEAAVELHTTRGPGQTSIAAIAERAGVQRHTVYAHFPGERELFAACSQHWQRANPFPEGRAWAGIADPERRLRAALDDVYSWYERVEPALALFVRDISLVPAQRPLMEARSAALGALADGLAQGLPRRRAVRAAIGHALEFETWRSLVRRQGLSRRAAVSTMVRLATTV
ncbi:MAG: TetR/AcrR family transcriptional regulator [Gaiellaceae bacterium]